MKELKSLYCSKYNTLLHNTPHGVYRRSSVYCQMHQGWYSVFVSPHIL